MEVMSRQQAALLKQRKYFTGKPCRKGHLAERYTLNATCVHCAIDRAIEDRREVREALNGQG